MSENILNNKKNIIETIIIEDKKKDKYDWKEM